jgi:hypothetical protein
VEVVMAAQRMVVMQVAALQAAALQMATWLTSLAVLLALVALKQIDVRSELGALVVGVRLVASPVAMAAQRMIEMQVAELQATAL